MYSYSGLPIKYSSSCPAMELCLDGLSHPDSPVATIEVNRSSARVLFYLSYGLPNIKLFKMACQSAWVPCQVLA
jgi:hypothetical protein